MSASLPTSFIPFIDGVAVARATPMPALIARLDQAFTSASVGAPERTAARISDDEELLLMPAWGDGSDIGVKIVHIDARRRPSISSIYALIDRHDGRPRALIDGTALTSRRTAAASVLAATKLARCPKRLLLLGSGALIAPLIEAYCAAFEIETIEIWARDRVKAEAIALGQRSAGRSVTVSVDLETSLMACNIVASATRASSPIIRGAVLAAGTHVDLIGAYRTDMSEADPETFRRAAIYVDTLAGARREAGDLIAAIAAGAIDWSDIRGDLHDLCSMVSAAQEGGRELTLFKSVGTAIEDLVAASMIRETFGLS